MARIAPSEAPRQRSQRKRDKDYLGYIGALGGPQGHGCVICRASPCEVAHVRYDDLCPVCGPTNRFMDENCEGCGGSGNRFNKRPTGMGEKPDDIWTLPLCPHHHRTGKDAQHNSNERDWWARKGLDPLTICRALQEAYPSIERGIEALAKAGRNCDD